MPGEGADMICNMHGVSSVKLNRCTRSHISSWAALLLNLGMN